MAAEDFNNGLIIGLSLQGSIFTGGGFAGDIVITAMESTPLELRVKYNEDTEWTIFQYSVDEVTGIIIFNTPNGGYVRLIPLNEEEILYSQLEV